ncbi:hypothetical protein DXG01_016819 [Tephrocybe rancida]|nr:hypothetical protein DXG01_016819 [Tephrocybe rancida]
MHDFHINQSGSGSSTPMHTEPDVKDQPPWSFVEAQRVWINSFVNLPDAALALLNTQVEAQRSADLAALRRLAGPSSPSPITEDVVSPDTQAIDCDLARVQLQIDALLIKLNACRTQMVDLQSERLEIASQTKNTEEDKALLSLSPLSEASKPPVESLPFGILAKIFELLPSLYDPACLKHHPSITDICAVSHVWRQALLHYPKVCNAIAPGIRSTFTYTPSGDLSYAHTSADGSSPSPFFQAIAPFYAHIEELRLGEGIGSPDTLAVFLGLPAGSLPLLTRIDLKGSGIFMPGPYTPVFEDGAPALRRVSLRIRHVGWHETLRWGSITHLKVETEYLGDGALHHFLLASPNLEVASFVLRWTVEDPIFDAPVTCARMKSFCISMSRYDAHFERMMSTICLPALETVDLALRRDAEKPSPFSSLATSLFSSDTLRRVCLSGWSQTIVGHLECLPKYSALEELVLVLSDGDGSAGHPREVLAALRSGSARGSNVRVLACLKSFSIVASHMRDPTSVAALATDVGELVVEWIQDPERAGVLESVSFRVDAPQDSSEDFEVALDGFRDRLRPWIRDAVGGLAVKAALEKVGTEYTDWFDV